VLYTYELIIYKRRILYLILLLLFIPGKNSMGLCGKLLYYIFLREFFGEKTCVFFAP